MPIPLADPHSPIPGVSPSDPHPTYSMAGTTPSSQRLGHSTPSARLQTHTLEGIPSRHWGRLQRRTHHSNQGSHYHSPRTRSSTRADRLRQPPNHHHRHQVFQQSTGSHDRSVLLQQQSGGPPSFPPTASSLSHNTFQTTMAATSTPMATAAAAHPVSRLSPPHPDRQQNQLSMDPPVFMESSGPMDSLVSFIASGDAAAVSRSRQSLHSTLPNNPSYRLHHQLSSTPMQRSLSNNPAMAPSYPTLLASIAATTSDSSSVSVAVSSSSTIGSSSSLQPPSLVQSAGITTVTGDRPSPTNLNSNSGRLDAPHSSGLHQISSVTNIHPDAGDSRLEVDDRIHFRLLDNIYFSTLARQASSTNMDIGIESQLLSQDGQETQPDYPMDYDLSTTYNPTPTGSGGEFITASLQRHPARQQDSLEDDDEDEDDDDDDGVDQVIESRRRVGADDGSLLSSRSLLERPQHAHLSPRSAAALTSSLSNQGQLMSGPFSNSSITPVLNGLSQQQSRYDGNPHFRRVSLNQQYRDDSAMGMIQRPFSTQYETILRNERSYGGCGEGFPVASTEALGDVWPLKFEMCFADGGEFNAAHAVENVLKNDSSVYCSRRSTNINICLKLAEPHKTCFLTQFKAKSPTTGFTAPCKEGLIFISHQPILLEETNAFDDMTRELYDEYMEKLHRGQGFEELLRKHGANADALVPAGFFQIDGPDETCTLDLTPNRSCRYVLIKLLRSRCTNSLQRPENIDLQYLGMIGYTGARSFASGSLL